MLYQIKAKAGSGGKGVVAFDKTPHSRRTKPIGNKGGDGGDFVIIASNTIGNLPKQIPFSSKRVFVKTDSAGDGTDANKTGMVGRNGKDLSFFVPVGTSVFAVSPNGTPEEMFFLKKLESNGARWVVAKGGSGGRGNKQFVNSKNRSPQLAEGGTDGETAEILLRLDSTVDVAFVGFPQSGKTALISALAKMNQKQKMRQNLPVFMQTPIDKVSLLEINFDAADTETIRQQIDNAKIVVVVLSDKIRESLAEQTEFIQKTFGRTIGSRQITVVLSDTDKSALNLENQQDVDALRSNLIKLVADAPLPAESNTNSAEPPVIKPLEKAPQETVKVKNGEFHIVHRGALLLAAGSNLNHSQALFQFRAKLDDFGVVRELEQKGVQLGDIVKVGRWEFEWS